MTKEELGAIAAYVYDFYDQQRFLQEMKERAVFEALPRGEQLALKEGCLTCHGKKKAKAAPSFKEIAQKPQSEIVDVIKKGSHGKWKGFERMQMPAFGRRLTDADIQILSKWIRSMH